MFLSVEYYYAANLCTGKWKVEESSTLFVVNCRRLFAALVLLWCQRPECFAQLLYLLASSPLLHFLSVNILIKPHFRCWMIQDEVNGIGCKPIDHSADERNRKCHACYHTHAFVLFACRSCQSYRNLHYQSQHGSYSRRVEEDGRIQGALLHIQFFPIASVSCMCVMILIRR